MILKSIFLDFFSLFAPDIKAKKKKKNYLIFATPSRIVEMHYSEKYYSTAKAIFTVE